MKDYTGVIFLFGSSGDYSYFITTGQNILFHGDVYVSQSLREKGINKVIEYIKKIEFIDHYPIGDILCVDSFNRVENKCDRFYFHIGPSDGNVFNSMGQSVAYANTHSRTRGIQRLQKAVINPNRHDAK